MTDITAIMASWSEDELIETLSGVLLKDEIEGLDEDLVAYISGLLSTLLSDNPSDCVEILDESMLPFLESVGCPLELIDEAKAAVLSKAVAAMGEPASAGTRKLQQGNVNMSSTLSEQSTEESNRYLWGANDKIKANANTQIDAYQEKTSSKDRRKQRQDLEKSRDELAQQQQQVEHSTKAGVSSMILPTIKSKEKDVQLQNVTLALDNGTLLMEHGELKFVYQRRYGLIGENGVRSNINATVGSCSYVLLRQKLPCYQELRIGKISKASLVTCVYCMSDKRSILKTKKPVFCRQCLKLISSERLV